LCLFIGMKLPFLSSIFGILIFSWAGLSNAHAQAVLRITEVMSSSGSGGTEDWFELTNFGDTDANVADYKYDDSPAAYGTSVALQGVTKIAPGESAIFFEGKSGKTVADFKLFWGLGDGVQVGTWVSSTNGLSSNGDTVAIFLISDQTLVTNVGFGLASSGKSFYYVYNSSGTLLSTGNPVSADGALGAFRSVDALGNIGSPGASASSLDLAFTSGINRFAKTGAVYSSLVTFQKRDGGDVATLSIVSGPAWLSLANVTQSGATLTGTPSVTQTGPQTITLRLSVVGQTTVELTGIITVFNTQPKVVLNEYNAVSGTSLHASLDGDLRLGRIEGNGGDWFELVVRGTGFGTTVDMRGWKIRFHRSRVEPV
jgi:hypothetical protein